MQITDIKIRKIVNEGKMRAVVSVTFDDELVIHDIKIIQGQDKFFLAMPSRKMYDGGFCDIAHPTSRVLREHLEREVTEAYLNEVSGKE